MDQSTRYQDADAGVDSTEPPLAQRWEQSRGPKLGTRVSPGVVKKAGAEFLGTFFLVFMGLGAALWGTFSGTIQMPGPAVFGLALAAASLVFASVCGAHFNPAITLTAAIAGRIQWMTGLIYVAAQVLGAMLASTVIFMTVGSLKALSDSTPAGALFLRMSNTFGAESQLEMPVLNAFLVELIATAILAAVFLAGFRRGVSRAAGAVAYGLTYAGLLTFLLPLTNGGINPARSSAVAVWATGGALQDLWLFWLAPLVGAALAGLIYRGFVRPAGDADECDEAQGTSQGPLDDSDEFDDDLDELDDEEQAPGSSASGGLGSADGSGQGAVPTPVSAGEVVSQLEATGAPMTSRQDVVKQQYSTQEQDRVDEQARKFFEPGQQEDKPRS